MIQKKRGKHKWCSINQKRSQELEPGLVGFLCTCNGKFRERDCLRESYNILNEFADELFGPQDEECEKSDTHEVSVDARVEDDIEASLIKEVETIKAEEKKKHKSKRFQVAESGANGVVFIKTTVPDPVILAYTIVSKCASSVQRSKFLLRLLPVEVTCKAYLEEITKAVTPLLEKYFSGEGKTFAIVFNHRNNDRLKRDEVIQKLAELVSQKSSSHKVDLKQPQLVILLEVIRNVCCIAVVPEYFSLKKYNLLENSLKGKSASGDDNRLTNDNENRSDCI